MPVQKLEGKRRHQCNLGLSNTLSFCPQDGAISDIWSVPCTLLLKTVVKYWEILLCLRSARAGSVSNLYLQSSSQEFEEWKGCSETPIISYHLSASISSTNWQKIAIISLFASYVPFQQARLSHYGGGKSSFIEVETLLVPPSPFLGSELEFSTSIPDTHFVVLFCFSTTSSSFFFSCLGLLHGWMFYLLFIYFFCACSLLKMYCAWWEKSQHGSECSPPYFLL